MANRSNNSFVNLRGEENLVARVRKTRKGQKSGFVSSNCGGESEGINGNGYYVIRRAAHGQGTGLHLYCSCPAQRFHSGYGKPCKHVKRLLAEGPSVIARGTTGPQQDLIIHRPQAISEALDHAESIPALDAEITAKAEAYEAKLAKAV